jgi:hypothetical protein
MRESGKRLEGRYEIADVSEEVVGDVEFVKFFEGREVIGEIL